MGNIKEPVKSRNERQKITKENMLKRLSHDLGCIMKKEHADTNSRTYVHIRKISRIERNCENDRERNPPKETTHPTHFEMGWFNTYIYYVKRIIILHLQNQKHNALVFVI